MIYDNLIALLFASEKNNCCNCVRNQRLEKSEQEMVEKERQVRELQKQLEVCRDSVMHCT